MRLKAYLTAVSALTLLLSPSGRAAKAEVYTGQRAKTSVAKLDVQQLTTRAYAGNAQAQFALARLYEDGTSGIKQDLAYAMSWYEEASRNGLKAAAERLNSLNSLEN